jgi:hypothetical protein
LLSIFCMGVGVKHLTILKGHRGCNSSVPFFFASIARLFLSD